MKRKGKAKVTCARCGTKRDVPARLCFVCMAPLVPASEEPCGCYVRGTKDGGLEQAMCMRHAEAQGRAIAHLLGQRP